MICSTRAAAGGTFFVLPALQGQSSTLDPAIKFPPPPTALMHALARTLLELHQLDLAPAEQAATRRRQLDLQLARALTAQPLTQSKAVALAWAPVNSSTVTFLSCLIAQGLIVSALSLAAQLPDGMTMAHAAGGAALQVIHFQTAAGESLVYLGSTGLPNNRSTHGLPQGSGACLFTDGAIYHGQWNAGRPHDLGPLSLASYWFPADHPLADHIWQGPVEDGRLQGSGHLIPCAANGPPRPISWARDALLTAPCILGLSAWEPKITGMGQARDWPAPPAPPAKPRKQAVLTLPVDLPRRRLSHPLRYIGVATAVGGVSGLALSLTSAIVAHGPQKLLRAAYPHIQPPLVNSLVYLAIPIGSAVAIGGLSMVLAGAIVGCVGCCLPRQSTAYQHFDEEAAAI